MGRTFQGCKVQIASALYVGGRHNPHRPLQLCLFTQISYKRTSLLATVRDYLTTTMETKLQRPKSDGMIKFIAFLLRCVWFVCLPQFVAIAPLHALALLLLSSSSFVSTQLGKKCPDKETQSFLRDDPLLYGTVGSSDFRKAAASRWARPLIDLPLCAKCRLVRSASWTKPIQHYDKFSSLEASASRGCWLCGEIERMVVSLDGHRFPRLGNPVDIQVPGLLMWFSRHSKTTSGYLDQFRGSNGRSIAFYADLVRNLSYSGTSL